MIAGDCYIFRCEAGLGLDLSFILLIKSAGLKWTINGLYFTFSMLLLMPVLFDLKAFLLYVLNIFRLVSEPLVLFWVTFF